MCTDYFDKYPGLKNLFTEMKVKRRSEILDHLKSNDSEYMDILKSRAEQSMVLRGKLKNEALDFEKYIDLVYSQELYELDAVYEYAFTDAIEALKKIGLL